jgi:DUF2911 family protein
VGVSPPVPARGIGRLARVLGLLLPCALLLAGAAVVRRSPRAQVTLQLAEATLSVDYGRPALRGRLAFGGLVPWGDVWRAGDDEATVFSTDAPLRVGDLLLPPGRYSLFVRPEPGRATLIFNREPDQWGAFNRDPALDLGAVALEVTAIATPIELFSIALEPVGARTGRLWLGWENSVWMTAFELASAEPPAVPTAPVEP